MYCMIDFIKFVFSISEAANKDLKSKWKKAKYQWLVYHEIC